LFTQNKWKEGSYRNFYDAEDFSVTVYQDIIKLTGDIHFSVLAKLPEPVDAKVSEKQEVKEDNSYGFGKLEKREDGSVLLEITRMANPKAEPLALKKAKMVMEKIKKMNPKAVIFDLRNNLGGSPYMTELICSYFMEEGLQLTEFTYRYQPDKKETEVYPVDPCKTWTYSTLAKQDRFLETPVFILTSRDTLSAAEDMVCHFKEKKRAVIVGETTGGGANPNRLFDAGPDFDIEIPIGQAVVPYGKTWEGTGITPHEKVQADQALFRVKALLKDVE